MNAQTSYVAVDLGAESGRVVLGGLAAGKVSLEEVSRFTNQPLALANGLHWDIDGLFQRSLEGVALAARRQEVSSVAVDSWGVDYGLLDESGSLLGLPFHYRDRRTEGAANRWDAAMADGGAYATTGIRQMAINTVYQLLAEQGSASLDKADRIALIPDLFAYWLCDVVVNERTDASTTGLLDARTGEWAFDLIRGLGLPEGIFGGLADPGTVLWSVSSGRAEALGLDVDMRVVATAGHDTAAAYAGAPLKDGNAAVLSSGTWSLLGVELKDPVLTTAAQDAELSNERGVFGTVRLLRNVMGLWLLQQCRERWSEEGSTLSYEELCQSAEANCEEPVLFDPDHPSLVYPGDMPARLEKLVRESGQPLPEDRGGLVKSIFTSLACKYRLVADLLEQVASKPIETIHVVGGGSRNAVLCQLTADLTGRKVLAGPSEASSLGNVLVQACALGHLSGLEEMREVSRASFPPVTYQPAGAVDGEAIYRRFLAVTGLADSTKHALRPQGRDT